MSPKTFSTKVFRRVPRPGAPRHSHFYSPVVVSYGGSHGRTEPLCQWRPCRARWLSQANEKKTLERELLVSVLESANRRDAKGYLSKYAGQANKKKRPPKGPGLHLPGTMRDRPLFVQGPQEEAPLPPPGACPVSIVKVSRPQSVDDSIMKGVAKTLSQLRTLGLLSVIVVDCGPDGTPALAYEEACRLTYFLHGFDKISALVLENVMARQMDDCLDFPPTGRGIYVAKPDLITQTLKQGKIPIITQYSCTEASGWEAEKIEAEGTVVALTRFFAGLQFNPSEGEAEHSEWEDGRPKPAATVETIVVLDPVGGIPVARNTSVPHRFVNLEHEYEPIVEHLSGELAAVEGEMERASEKGGSESSVSRRLDLGITAASTHLRNLEMVRDALSMLPSSASALITTPSVAANTAKLKADLKASSAEMQNLVHMPVGTRATQNPLIHNLLTGKPVYSSSLPIEKVSRRDPTGRQSAKTEMATLVKRGMHITILPSTDLGSWRPPKPGEPRLRLTDTCIDLPRLIYLIEDSFNRKLDARDYLNRVHDNLAGVIIAGNYEGGAILTWERPFGLSEEEAYSTGRFVPYLDKFAVLKSRQGSGGVADIVFNAMVQDCFPRGVCWRSRQNNPVNKWYFERSVGGTCRLAETQWSMFWTTPSLKVGDQALKDYENVCREIQPSWADKKHIAD